MVHGSSDELEERLSRLRSQIDQLTAALPSPLAGTKPSSAVAPSSMPSDAERVDGKLEKFEARLDQQVAELSDQVQAIVAEIRERAARRSAALPVDTSSPVPPKSREAVPVTSAGALDRGQSLEGVPLLDRDEIFEGEIISVQPVPRRRLARGVPSGQLLGGVLVLGVIGAGAVAGSVLLIPALLDSGRALVRTGQTEGATPAPVESGREQAAAANVEAAKRLADARAALQRAVDRIESGERTGTGNQSRDQVEQIGRAAAAVPASAVANAPSTTLSAAPVSAPPVAAPPVAAPPVATPPVATPPAAAPPAAAPPTAAPPTAAPAVTGITSTPPSPSPPTGQEGLSRNGDAVVALPQTAVQNPPVRTVSPTEPVAGPAAVRDPASNPEPRSAAASVPVTSGPVIGAVVPVSPFASAGSQTILVSGQGFQAGLRVTAFLPGNGGSTTMSSMQVQRVTATSLEIVMSLANRGAWGLRIDNPDGRQSTVFSFTVR